MFAFVRCEVSEEVNGGVFCEVIPIVAGGRLNVDFAAADVAVVVAVAVVVIVAGVVEVDVSRSVGEIRSSSLRSSSTFLRRVSFSVVNCVS